MMRRIFYLLFASITAILLIQGCDMISGSGAPDPKISSLQPNSGPPGTMVTINGSGFSADAANNTVTFGGTSAPVSSATKSSIETQVPDGLSQGSVPVEVTVGEKTASGPSFTVEQAAPGISSVEPDSGTVGTEVTIKGMNFSATASENTITFNGTEAPVNGAAKDQLLTEVPSGATDGPIKVTVKQKSTTGPDFDVITEGTLKLITSTTGKDQDSDGYTGTVDGSSSKLFKTNDDKYFANLQKGSHDVELSGIAQNCTVSGNNPRSVNISPGDTSSTTFDISCEAVANNQIAFHTDRDGNFEIYLMYADGSNPQRVTNNSATDRWAAISNDGTQIAFTSNRNGNNNLYIMNVDGTNVRQLTTSTGNTFLQSWSPDDSKLAYRDDRSGNDEIYTIRADGSGETRLTNNSSYDAAPSWSPDGDKIAFTSNRDGDSEIYTMNRDGTGVKQITDNSSDDFGPRWSPDGSKIVFNTARDGNGEIYVMNADGTGQQRITNNSALEQVAGWSPDGTKIVFDTDRDGNREIYKINADGSGTPINLTADPATDRAPHWSPVE